MYLKFFFTFYFVLFSFVFGISQTEENHFLHSNDSTHTLSLLFIGDIMGHDSQIRSAKQADGSYNYDEVFRYLKEVISGADISIANLEVTLAGKPFKGYPQFSSPDALALACKNSGIDVLTTANNHTVDRGKKGILRTIKVLDSLQIKHTGSFENYQQKEQLSPLIIEKKGFKIALLNYTYGTNGLRVPFPTVVNLIQKDSIAKDIQRAKRLQVDKIIVAIHWGIEYQNQPNKTQKNLADFCFLQGADIVIGSHPHVIQKSEWKRKENSETFVCYSLGNFISNQRKRYTDGGQMLKIILEKKGKKTQIKESGHLLTWVYTPMIKGKKHFHILPCAKYELMPDFFISPQHFEKMKLFISDARNLLNTNNKNVKEYFFYESQWKH